MITGMTKDDQIRAVAAEAGITSTQARMAIDALTAVITVGLISDGRITVHGLGNFETKRRSERRVRNPATGDMMDVPARTVVKFKPSSYLRDRVEETHP
jgi:DNA-binding protein HU-beta